MRGSLFSEEIEALCEWERSVTREDPALCDGTPRLYDRTYEQCVGDEARVPPTCDQTIGTREQCVIDSVEDPCDPTLLERCGPAQCRPPPPE